MRPARLAALVALSLQPAFVALAATPVVVTQINRAFNVKELRIARGDTVRFRNTDEFLHHVYVRSPSFSFNSGEQEPGHDVDVVFPVSGRFDVRCEIHPRMLLTVTVE